MKGAREEDLALGFLLQQGLILVVRNFRAPGGELDLVLRDGPLLVIVEVRKRAHRSYGSAAESVDGRKQGRIVLAAQHLLAQRPALARLPARFDVIALDADDRIEWIRAAFDVSG